MTDVALVTYQHLPDLNPDDHPLRAALTALGATTHAIRWDEPGVDWRHFDAVILRSCWDYHLRLAEFRAWLDAIELSGARLWNPAAVVRWNLDKIYLRDLKSAGVAVPETVWLDAGAAPDLRGLLVRRGWVRAVVKPRVSLSAHDTWVTDRDQAAADQERLARLVQTRGALVQEFVPEVKADGELSLVHVAGGFTHAVRKRAGPDDFRVQRQYGGSAESVEPSTVALEGARRALAIVPGPWLYARVDGVERDGALMVMELEVIEPELFLVLSRDAVTRFARAILTRS